MRKFVFEIQIIDVAIAIPYNLQTAIEFELKETWDSTLELTEFALFLFVVFKTFKLFKHLLIFLFGFVIGFILLKFFL